MKYSLVVICVAALCACAASQRPPASPESVEPAVAGPGNSKPAPKVPGCVERAVRVPASFAAYASGSITVRFEVETDGAVSRFRVIEPVPQAVAQALEKAVRSCTWVPGRDAAGEPVPIWVVLPIQFTSG